MNYFKGTARIKNYESGGRIPLYFRKLIHECLERLPDNTLVEFIIKPRQRSKDQNEFYWAVAVPFVREMFAERGQNLSADDVHELIVGVIWKHTKIVHMPDGKPQEIRRSSTELTTAEWEDKMTILRAWCAENGAQLPLPNEEAL